VVETAVNAQQLRRKAMNLLSRREHGAVELREKLARSGGDSALINSVVQDLAGDGLQSEDRFVEAFVHSQRQRGNGPVRILRELELRGVSRELAEQAVAPRDQAWFELAKQLRQRRFGDGLPAAATEWQKQARHLKQKGFSSDQVRFALREQRS
jgi:regulatory protein